MTKRSAASLNTVTERKNVNSNSDDETSTRLEHCYKWKNGKKNSDNESSAGFEHCYEKENSKKEQ